MQNTPSAMHEEGRGSTRPQLPRLNPREIATLLLPGTNVQVMDATDEQFEAMVKANDLHVKDVIVAWSFDDRVRFINAARKCGIDLFAITNKNNSSSEQETIQNNSPNRIDSELFASSEQAPQASAQVSDASIVSGYVRVTKRVLAEPEKSSQTE